MGLKRKIKESIVKRNLNKKKKNSPFNVEEAENYYLSENCDEFSNNSYYFSCHDVNGESLVLRIAQRAENIDEVWFIYKDSNNNIYSYKNQSEKRKENPFSLKCIVAGKEWSISFKGKLNKYALDNNKVIDKIEKEVNVELNATFTATKPIFEFSRHMHSTPMARAIANEKWTKTFFSELSTNFQVHYEQLGQVNGTLKIDTIDKTIKLDCIRDHSYGKRDWNYMDSHIWLMAILKNGDVLNISMVSYPVISGIQSGYYETKNNTKDVVCVDYATPMSSFIVDNCTPLEFKYSGTLVDGTKYNVTAEKEMEVQFKYLDGKYTLCEGLGTFIINGIKARGVMEFGFNGDKTRVKFINK